MIGATLLTWAETLAAGRDWDEDRDAPRIRAAFRTLAERCRRWPAPADFFDALPRIEPPRVRLAPLEYEARRRRGMEHLAQIARHLHVVPDTPRPEADDDRPVPAA